MSKKEYLVTMTLNDGWSIENTLDPLRGLCIDTMTVTPILPLKVTQPGVDNPDEWFEDEE